MKKSILKSYFRLFKSEIARFLAMALISAVGIGFISGLTPAEAKLKSSVSEYLISSKAPDLIAFSSSDTGFSLEESEALKSNESVKDIEFFSYYESSFKNERIFRFYSEDLKGNNLLKMTLTDGRYPEKDGEIVVENGNSILRSYDIGSEIVIPFYTTSGLADMTLTVVGKVKNPLYMSSMSVTSWTNEAKDIDTLFYFSDAHSPLTMKNGANIALAGLTETGVYNSKYLSEVKEKKEKLESSFDKSRLTFNPLNRLSKGAEEGNEGVIAIEEYAKKVNNIAIILSLFFVAVVSLVVSSTISRLVDEDRDKIACFKSLGYSDAFIFFRYASFAFVSVGAGALLGYFLLGQYFLLAIYSAFSISFAMPAMAAGSNALYGLIGMGLVIASSLFGSLHASHSTLKESPALLLFPKAPKSGKPIFLEKLKGFWKMLSFSNKRSLRNIFRNPSRLLLTILTVAGSTVLLLASFALLDSSSHYEESTSLLASISVVLLVSASALSILVLYNLTNITISERKRSIATMMVLGYRDKEVAFSIYEEINVMVTMGIIIGLPLGVLFCYGLFKYVDFGDISYIKWYSYIIVAGLEALISFLSDALLYPKIKKTDMNGCLKAEE